MIVGKTTPGSYGRPVVELPVAGFEIKVRFVIDTGSNCLLVPRSISDEVRRPLTGPLLAKLPNNVLEEFEGCMITFDWLGTTYDAAALICDGGYGLIGVHLFHDSQCKLEVNFANSEVHIRPKA